VAVELSVEASRALVQAIDTVLERAQAGHYLEPAVPTAPPSAVSDSLF